MYPQYTYPTFSNDDTFFHYLHFFRHSRLKDVIFSVGVAAGRKMSSACNLFAATAFDQRLESFCSQFFSFSFSTSTIDSRPPPAMHDFLAFCNSLQGTQSWTCYQQKILNIPICTFYTRTLHLLSTLLENQPVFSFFF